MKKGLSVLAFFLIVFGSDIGARYLDRFRSPCSRHDTHGALSRILIETKTGSGLRISAIQERGRMGDRFSCAATFDFVTFGTLTKTSLLDVSYTVTQPDDDTLGKVDIPADAWQRISSASS